MFEETRARAGDEWKKMSNEEFNQYFKEWAASWDASETGTDATEQRGDEINVGDLWEDKSQKDFKSYL